MSATETPTIVTGVDFVSVPTRDLETAVAFYGETLGLRRSVYRPERSFAEFETGTVTLALINCPALNIPFTPNAAPIALQVEDVPAARGALEAKGVTFAQTIDSGVCHMAHFRDPDGNVLMLHHRYAPRG